MGKWHIDMSLNSEVDVKLSGLADQFKILVYCVTNGPTDLRLKIEIGL